MSQDDLITVRGYVTAEPRMWQRTPEQLPVATLRVGSTPRRLNRETGEWQDGETSYYTVKCWRKLAENVHGSVRKGDMVLVRGKVLTRSWLDDQQRVRTEVLIEADSVGHDLAFGWSRFNRGLHTPASVMRGLEQGEAIRQDMAPDPELPDDIPLSDADEARLAGDGGSGDPGPGPASGAPEGPGGRDDDGFDGLAGDASEPAGVAAPF